MVIKSTEGQFKEDSITLSDDKFFFVIVGNNNSGKTTFLREIVKTVGSASHRVTVNRTILNGEGSQDKNYEKRSADIYRQQREVSDDNTERGILTLQDLFQLKDVERAQIIEWYNQYFPNLIYEEREVSDNSASPMLLKVNGFSITRQGSGMRATLEIFVRLFDPKIRVLCIDEPELGLEPQLQKYLFQALKDKASPDKKIIIATHSHHFLDTEVIDNNLQCSRDTQQKITLNPITDLKPIIFKLLGNTLSSYLLPERILILEGPSDMTFLMKALEYTNKGSYYIHNSRGIGNVTYAIQAITQFLRFNNQIPIYIDKIYVIVDRPDQGILVREWERKVSNKDQICTLLENGIEYYYPERILREIFNTSDIKKAIVDGYLGTKCSYNGISISKTELSRKVAALLIPEDLSDSNNQLFTFLNSLPNS